MNPVMEATEKKTSVKVDISCDIHERIVRLKRYWSYIEQRDITINEVMDRCLSHLENLDPTLFGVMKGDKV